MNRNKRQVEEFVARGGRRRIWKKIVSALACVVVFCTTYALILPAITMATVCGYEEHIHTDACYQQVTTRPVTTLTCTAVPHAHGAECYDAGGNLTCGQADFFVHSHSALCVNEAGELVCTLGTAAAHTHGEDCYSIPVHQHGEDCILREKGEQTCTTAEGEGAHTHEDACYEITDALICGMEESEGYAHSEACYEQITEIICGLEESEGYAHSEVCYDEDGNLICEKEETPGHAHDDGCKQITSNLICEKEETAGHTHEDACYETTSTCICPLEENPGHLHGDACYAWTETLTCELIEGEPEADAVAELTCELTEIKLHTHSDACYDEAGALCCPDLEILAHQHSEECLTTTAEAVPTDNLTCGLAEGEDHTHTDRCYGTWVFACSSEEHTHTYDCYSDATETTAATTEATEAEEDLSAEEDYGISLWALLPEERIDGGTVADTNITWLITKNEAGEYFLYIDGEGALPDTSDTSFTLAPWRDYSSYTYHLVIGEGITYIGRYSFLHMKFATIDFGGVTEIGYRAFFNLQTTNDITIPGTVKTIGGQAFYTQNTNHKCFYLGEGVETVGSGAFTAHGYYITAPQVFYVPASVKSMGTVPMLSVSEYDVAEDNPYYCDVDGVLYTKDMTTLVSFPARMELAEYTIPDTVTTVMSSAFTEVYLKKLNVPASVTSMSGIGGLGDQLQEVIFDDDVAFNKSTASYLGIYAMRKVHFPENTTYSLHGTLANAWQNGTSMLESLKIPKGVTSIKNLCYTSDWVRMPNLKTVLYDAANATLDTYGINGYATYELTIGKNVDNLPANFTYIAKQSSDIYFEPENAFVAAEGAFAGTFTPLETLSGTLYADSQGALYRYDAVALTAELVYVSPGIENLTIPETITPEEGVTCTVTSVGQDALRQAIDLTGITIAIPDNLSVVASYGFANCPTLTSINGAATVDGVIALFPTTTTFGSNAFYNTGLTGAPVFNPGQMDGDNKLAFDQTAEDADIPTMHITVKSETGTWLDNTDTDAGGGGYQLLTGDGLVTTITVGNTDSQTSFYYRVYFQVTGADATLSITPGTTYTYDGQDATCYSTNDPYTVYLEFVPAEGVTASIPVTVTYPSPTSPGGGLTVWGVVQTQEGAEANAGQVVSDGNTIQAYWTTQPDDFTFTSSVLRNQSLGVKGDGEGGAYPNNHLEYKKVLSRTNTETSAYGKDYISSVEVVSTMSFPEGVGWNDQVLADIQAGNVSTSGEYIYAGDTLVARVYYNSWNAQPLTHRKLWWDESDGTVKLGYAVLNRVKNAEIAGVSIIEHIYRDALSVDTDKVDPSVTNYITNTTTSYFNLTHKSPVSQTAEASHTISVSSGPKMWLTQNNPSNVYFGEDATVSVLNLDNLGTDYIGTEEGSYSLELRRDNYTQIYYTPENIDKMFSEEFGDDLTITITNALLGTYTPVKDVTGGTAYIHAGNSDTESRRETLVITKSPNGYFINGTEYAGTAKEALRAVGYAVSGTDKWTLNWKLNEADEDFVYYGGHVQLYNVYPTAKNTFQYLTADWTRQFNSGGRVYTWHGGYVLTPARKTIDSGVRSYYVTPEVRFEQAVYNEAGANISGDLRGETGDELKYVISMTHFGNGAYENLPMVANITGVQNLLVSKADNTALAALGLPEHGDSYLLTPGTYENVTVGTDDEGNKLNAASVTVTEADNGLHTQIKWYFANIEGGNYLKMVEYHTLVDIGLVDSTDYTLASTVYLNDRTGSRLSTPPLVGGDATFERTRAFLEIVGDTPAGDVTDSDNFSLVGSGDRVTFRVKYRNITESDTVTIRGGSFAEGLPDTLGTYTWVQGSNVVDFRVVTEGEGTTATGLEDWYIGSNYADIQGDRQYMMWPETSAITLAPGGTVYFYYTLAFPANDPDNASDAWDTMANTLVGESIYADSYVGRYYARTELMLQEPGSVILQKGVYGQYYTHHWGTNPSPTRVYYNNPFYGGTTMYMDRYITYYVTLYNGGNARLYLNEIQDQLPDGFQYLRLINSGGTSGSVNSIETQGGYKTANQLSSIVGTDEVTYRSAKISATNDENGLSFTIGAGSGQYAVKYDAARGQYYLSKGEAITFRYMCTIGKTTETLDTATNTVSMAYTNYLEAGVEQIGKAQLSVTAPSITNINDSNDGARLVGISGNHYTLTSQVSVIRGAVKPGVIKVTESYLADGMTEAMTYGGSVGPEDTVNWKVTLYNDGMLAMTGYKFVDIMPAPYSFEGNIMFYWKDHNGNQIFSGPLCKILERSEDDTTITLLTGGNTDQKRTLTIGSEDPVSVNYSNLVIGGWKSLSAKLWIKRDDKGNEIMTLEFGETLSLAEGGYMELTFSSRNPTTTYANKVYTNQVQLIPTEQEFDTVGQGSELYDGEGNLIGAKNYSAVNVAFGYATTSSVSVSQDQQLGTGADYILIDKDDEVFRYTLRVGNTTDNAMTKLVMIDNLPQEGDHSPFDTDPDNAIARGSQFKVSLADDPDFVVTVTDRNGIVTTLDPSQYTIEYSTATSFGGTGSADWTGDPNEKWTQDSTGARSIRVIINDDTAQLIPSKSTVDVSFNAKIDDEVEQGQIAWNSFGYHYGLDGVSIELEAMPLSYGVKIASIPVLEKKLVDSVTGNIKPAAAPEAEEFTFLIYPGAARSFTTVDSLKEALENEGIAYLTPTVTVEADKTASGQVEMDAENWSWVSGQQYTIVELPTDREYSFVELGTSSTNSYTFTYDPDDKEMITCKNLYRPWSISITKVDAMDQTKTLAGAQFALYSPNAADQADPDAYAGTAVDLTKFVNEKTWYLVSAETSGEDGKFGWTDLLEDTYLLVELKAPDGYKLPTTSVWYIQRTEAEEGQYIREIVNEAGVVLPHTGGAGTNLYTMGGLLLIAAAGILLLYSKQKKRKEEKTAS